jgi:myo-inositol-1(or 4)-monophosphatase
MQETLIEALKAGAAEIEKFFNGKFNISNKEGVNNLVTEADFASDNAIRKVIKAAFPDHGIVSEEAEEKTTQTDYRWIVDPIDGTINFANGIPICCVSIALEYKKEMILGGVYNSLMNELFLAEKGKGATLNGEAISVSEKSELATSCLVTGFPYTYLDMPNGPLEIFSRLVRRGIPVRRLGSAALDLCWVAAGRFDGFYEHQLYPWDSAAGFLIVEEAGGRVTNMKGKKYSPYKFGLVATNGKIHDQLLKECDPELIINN